MSSNLKSVARGTLTRNANYKRNGLKSYVHALKKWHIMPTVDGPYLGVSHIEQKGQPAILKKFGVKAGGKAHVSQKVLQKKDASTGQTGDVPAQDVESQAEYLASVGIGTPAQTLNLDFDTGSADLWVFSTELPSSTLSQAGSSHSIFDSSKSSTFKKTSDTWQISYGDGSTASGTTGTDVLDLGGFEIKNQVIELANTLSTQFAQGPGDGLLGLAFDTINTVTPTQAKTPTDNLATEYPNEQRLFTAWLGESTDNSFYTFGYIDQTAANGLTPAYAPVDSSEGFWMFDSPNCSVNGQAIQKGNTKAIADTGTTLLLTDDTTLAAIYAQIPGATMSSQQQGYVFPSDATIPTIEFSVGDTLFSLDPETIKFEDLGDGTYYGGIQSAGNQGFDILGDVFLRNVYAIFDQGTGSSPQFGAIQRTLGQNTATGSSSSGSAPATSGGASQL
ncbi:aspartic proteinase precursor [Teratosphaeria nubilosa]|uniref:Aspartic proteinase n=1 Tax=Teratosphaeria nubilosa TaxID=161662 RepID=A0A6G1LPR8_9PEZI|nr:aspartic proteinase precursor [Teratosphaeria nubilosa]